jgi:hypothetical protein
MSDSIFPETKMRHRAACYLLLFLALLLAGLKSSAQEENSLYSTFETEPRNVQLDDRITCSPKRLYRGETLVLNMTVPHGGDLAIVGPKKQFSFIVFEPSENSRQQPLISREKFESMAQLRLATDKVREMMWAADETPNRLIFTRTGWYEVWLSANLETDDGTPVAKCRVYYMHRRRP